MAANKTYKISFLVPVALHQPRSIASETSPGPNGQKGGVSGFARCEATKDEVGWHYMTPDLGLGSSAKSPDGRKTANNAC